MAPRRFIERGALRWAVAIALATGMTGGFRIASAQAAQGKSLSIGLGVASYYDDNILQYSSDQLALFQSGTKPERFSIKTSDDVIWRPSVSTYLENKMGDGRSWALSLKGTGEFHDKNRTADLHSFSVGWRQDFSRGSGLSLSGYHLPHYYLRQLFDEDVPSIPGLSRYHRAEFGLTIASIGWRQRVGKKNQTGLSYQYEHRDYNRDFRERTSNTHQAILDYMRRRLARRGSLGFHGGYRLSDAKGSDGDETPGAPPDDPDVSYHGWLAGVDARMDLARRAGWGLASSLGYELGTRDYTSNAITDKYHFGRNDLSHSVDLTVRWSARLHWAARGFYRYERYIANLGVAAPATTDVGSYSENQVGLAIDGSATLWRQRRETESTPEGGESP